MGYFPNGTSFEIYEQWMCRNCVHHKTDPEDGPGCAVLEAHLLYNYDHCNEPNSILHILIPRKEDDIENAECRMFHPRDPMRCPDTGDLFDE